MSATDSTGGAGATGSSGPAGPTTGPGGVVGPWAAARFGRLLRLYPPSWRAANGEALLGVMLDVADAEGRDRPTAREGTAVVRHAARAWLDAASGRVERADVRPSFAGIGPAALVLGATLSAVSFLFGEWFPGVQLLWADDFHAARFGPFPSAGPLLYAVWLLALGAVVAGAARAGRALLALAAVGGPVLWTACDGLGVARPPLLLMYALTVFAVVALVGLPSLDDAARRRLGILTAGAWAATTTLLVAVTAVGLSIPSWDFPFGRWYRTDVSAPGGLDMYLGWGFYRTWGLSTLLALALPFVVGWLLVGIATVWRSPGHAMAAGVLGVPLEMSDLRTSGSLWLPGPLQGYGSLVLLALGMLSITLSLLVVAVRTARAGAGAGPTGATA